MRANDYQPLIKLLADEDFHFSCSTRSEMQQIHHMGIEAHRVLRSKPCFEPSDASYGQYDFALTAFGSEHELHQVRQYRPRSPLLLRIKVGDGGSTGQRHMVQDASLSQLPRLLRLAHQLQLVVKGTSFHLGSGVPLLAFKSAMAHVHRAWQVAADQGCHFDTISVGGGFSGVLPLCSLRGIAAAVEALPLVNPSAPQPSVMAEPGRFFCTEAQTLAVRIIGRRHMNGQWNYYVNNGVYQDISHLLVDHPTWNQPATLNPFVRILGHSQYGNELITDQLQLPELQFGDWLVFPAMGAYTSAANSDVSGLPNTLCNVITQSSDASDKVDLTSAEVRWT
jgi:ornithine decarboxylase